MALVDEVNKRLRAVEVELAEARGESRGRKQGAKPWLALAVAVALGLGGWSLTQVISQGRQIVAIQALLEQKLPALAIRSVDNNPQEAAQNYDTASSLLAPTEKRKVPVSPKIADALAVDLAKQVQHDSLPEYWHLASILINGKSQPLLLSMQPPHDCLTDTYKSLVFEPSHPVPNDPIMNEVVIMENCSLRLDNPNFDKSLFGQTFRSDRAKHPDLKYFYKIRNVRVVYGGGDLIPLNSMQFEHCTFEFVSATTPPTPVAKALGRQLLANYLPQGIQAQVGPPLTLSALS